MKTTASRAIELEDALKRIFTLADETIHVDPDTEPPEIRRMRRLQAEAPRLYEVLLQALKDSGCDGDLCPHSWHDDLRRIKTNIEDE